MVRVIKRGLDLPIAGTPVQQIGDGPPIRSVALVGDDYVGMRPTILVGEGDRVRVGQPVLEDKKTPGVIYTAPAAGRVVALHRGEKRRFISLVIEIDGNEHVEFPAISNPGEADRQVARDLLRVSGMWTALRTRPYSKVPAPSSSAHSIFVTAIDTSPLAADPELVIDRHPEWFVQGLWLLSRVNEGTIYVCTGENSRVPGDHVPGVVFEQFSGPHPAGLVGTHIHFLAPAGAKRTVWHIGYQDVIAIGHLCATGRLMTERVVSLGGPAVSQPRLLRTRLGCNLGDFVRGQLAAANGDQAAATRVVSGSVLCGRRSEAPIDYLGRYHLQVTALHEGTQREFLGWQRPGRDKFSITRAFVGSWLAGKRFRMDTNLNGGHRAIVPIGTYERVMPLDLMPTHLLKSLIVRDVEQAQQLGALELDEEDLALCTYVCPGKYDYASILRDNLTRIEKEG